MNEFQSRTASGADRLHAALGSTVAYTAVGDDGEVVTGYPKTVDAIVRHESTMRVYEGDGDIITEAYKVAVRTDAIREARIGDYLAIDGVEYAVVDVEIRGEGLTTVTAERTRNARVGSQQGFVR
jgi:hypothetical protein